MCVYKRVHTYTRVAVIDLDKFGLNGEVPAAIAEARDMMIEETPQVWELVTQSDPFIKSVLKDPFKAAELAQRTFGIDIDPVVEASSGFSGPVGP